MIGVGDANQKQAHTAGNVRREDRKIKVFTRS